MSKRIPEASMVFADTSYGMAYAWKIEHEGIMALGNTRLDACCNWLEALKAEFPPVYAQYMPCIFRPEGN